LLAPRLLGDAAGSAPRHHGTLLACTPALGWLAAVGTRTKSPPRRAGHGGAGHGAERGAGRGAEPLAHPAASGCGFPEDAALSLQGDALSPAGGDAAVLPALSAALGL